MSLMLVWLVLGAIICGIAGGIITAARGAGIAKGALLGGILGPLGVIASFAFGGEADRARIGLAQGELRACPICAEPIRAGAVKCRYCGADVKPVAVVADKPGGDYGPLIALIIGAAVLVFVILFYLSSAF